MPEIKYPNILYTPKPWPTLVRVFLNVGQLLKQRWLEGSQTVASLSKHYGDRRDR